MVIEIDIPWWHDSKAVGLPSYLSVQVSSFGFPSTKACEGPYTSSAYEELRNPTKQQVGEEECAIRPGHVCLSVWANTEVMFKKRRATYAT